MARRCRNDFKQTGHLIVSPIDENGANMPDPDAATNEEGNHAAKGRPAAESAQAESTAGPAARINGLQKSPFQSADVAANGCTPVAANRAAAYALPSLAASGSSKHAPATPPPQSLSPSHLMSAGQPQPCASNPLTPSDKAAIEAFHRRGVLDFLVVSNATESEQLAEVHRHLVAIGATETKLLVKLRVRARRLQPLL